MVFRALLSIAVGALLVWVSGFGQSAIASSSPQLRAVQWSYLSDTGPDYWAELDPTFASCKSGRQQSPINLIAAESVDIEDPTFHYEPVPLNILNNGHTVQVPYAPGSYMEIEGDSPEERLRQRYNLLQFHFHSPSEHAIDSKPWDAELHLVHQNNDGDLAVVAVLLQEGSKNSDDNSKNNRDYQLINNNLPTKVDEKIRTGTTINASNLLPDQTTTYRYSGSLTTPPCSESVIWLVMTKPVNLSHSQIEAYKQLLNHNNRPLQRLNNRIIQMDSSP